MQRQRCEVTSYEILLKTSLVGIASFLKPGKLGVMRCGLMKYLISREYSSILNAGRCSVQRDLVCVYTMKVAIIKIEGLLNYMLVQFSGFTELHVSTV